MLIIQRTQWQITHKALSTLSQKSATVAENGETTATFAEFGDSHTFLRQSHFSTTVAVFGDKLSHFSATVWTLDRLLGRVGRPTMAQRPVVCWKMLDEKLNYLSIIIQVFCAC